MQGHCTNGAFITGTLRGLVGRTLTGVPHCYGHTPNRASVYVQGCPPKDGDTPDVSSESNRRMSSVRGVPRPQMMGVPRTGEVGGVPGVLGLRADGWVSSSWMRRWSSADQRSGTSDVRWSVDARRRASRWGLAGSVFSRTGGCLDHGPLTHFSPSTRLCACTSAAASHS